MMPKTQPTPGRKATLLALLLPALVNAANNPPAAKPTSSASAPAQLTPAPAPAPTPALAPSQAAAKAPTQHRANPAQAPALASAQSPARAASANSPAAAHDRPTGLPTVAIDIGREPKVAKGQPPGAGQAEFAFNQRLADQLAGALLAQKVAVKRIPSGLTPAQRAKAAAGATLLVSVNHEVLAGAQQRQAAGFSGYALAVSRQQAAGQPMALGCARQVSAALMATGRQHSLLYAASAKQPPGSTARPWADAVLGVQAQDELPVLKLAPVPALRLQVAVLANAADGQHAQDAAWTRTQAQAAAKGLVACLKAQASL